MPNMIDEFSEPIRSFEDRPTITPVQIMAMFPHVDVIRSVQGNSLSVMGWNPTARRWQSIGTASNETEALVLAAKFHA